MKNLCMVVPVDGIRRGAIRWAALRTTFENKSFPEEKN